MSSKTRRYYCAAEGCHAGTLKRGKYGYMADIKFLPFPTQKKNAKSRRAWLSLLRRKDYDPPPHHRVCSRHFVDGMPTEENPCPTLFAYNNFKEHLQCKSMMAVNKRLQYIETETAQKHDESHDQLLIECDEYPTPRVASEETVQTICETLDTVVQLCLPDHQYSLTTVNENQYSPETVDRGIQTHIGMVEFMELKKKSENPDAIVTHLFIENVTASDKSVKKYTGVPSKSMLNGLYGKMFSSFVI